MMGAEKVAEDLRDAHDTVAGDRSPTPALAAAIRRLERRNAQAPGAGRAGGEGGRHRDHLAGGSAAASRTGCAWPTTIRASWSGSRSGCSRCGRRRRKYNVPVDGLAALAERFAARSRADRCRRGAAEAAGRRSARRRATLWRGREGTVDARRKAADALDKAVNKELKPLKLERAQFSHPADQRRGSAGPHGIDRVEFWVQTNPGTQAGPADEGRLRRRAGALPAGAEGGAGGSRLGADACIR